MSELVPIDSPPTVSDRNSASAAFNMNEQPKRDTALQSGIERVSPWNRLIALIELMYLTSGHIGHPPIRVQPTLRMHYLQQLYALAEDVLEDTLQHGMARCGIAGIVLSHEAEPDTTMLLEVRRLLQSDHLACTLIDKISAKRAVQGMLVRSSTVMGNETVTEHNSTKTVIASIRAKVERPRHVLNSRPGHGNACYDWLARNKTQLFRLFASAKLMIASRRLWARKVEHVC